jgi:hypothetical protein
MAYSPPRSAIHLPARRSRTIRFRETGSTRVDPFNYRTANGPSDFDARNRFSAAYEYALPFGKGKALLSGISGAADKLVGGFRFDNTVVNTLHGALARREQLAAGMPWENTPL